MIIGTVGSILTTRSKGDTNDDIIVVNIEMGLDLKSLKSLYKISGRKVIINTITQEEYLNIKCCTNQNCPHNNIKRFRGCGYDEVSVSYNGIDNCKCYIENGH